MNVTTTEGPISNNLWKISLMVLLLFSVYGLLFHAILTHQSRLDFSSLYSACRTLTAGDNPYRSLLTTYLPIAIKLPANLNPPIVLWLFSPLSRLNYDSAVALWSALSFILGLIGAGIAFNYAFSPDFMRKNWPYLYLIYLSFFATIMNAALAQLGALILFFIMSGYHLYMRKHDYSAGIIWGLIISMKLFPALLFFYALIQKRYRVCLTMLLITILMWVIPLLVYSMSIYSQYFSMMSQVLWYGDNWNASIYGIIFRLFVDIPNHAHHWLFIRLLYGTVSCIFLIIYFKKMVSIEKTRVPHQSFCLTLIMMLLLSPLGWLYYFPLLAFPLALTWLSAINNPIQPSKTISVWFLCLFFINFPMGYTSTHMMPSFISKLSVYSLYFYGLLLLLHLTNKMTTYNGDVVEKNITISYSASIFYIIFSFDILVVITTYIMRLFHHAP